MIARCQDKEAWLLKATSEANENQTMNNEHEFKEKMATFEQMLTKERLEFLEEKEEVK